MKKLLLILSFCFPWIAGFSVYNSVTSDGTKISSGFIDITVLSNIDKHFFQYDILQQCLSFGEKPETGYSSGIIIPVKEFKCNNKSVYKDFLSLLKVEQYPFLEINIPYNPNINYDSNRSVLIKNVSITIAGVSNHYDLNCKIGNGDNEDQILDGTTKIKLTDFGLVPPVRLLGFVRVKNEIAINFEFCIKSPGFRK